MRLVDFKDDPLWWVANKLFKTLKLAGLGKPQYHLYDYYSKLRISTGALGNFFNDTPFGRSPVYNDLYYLYRWVRKNNPATILEIGSGCSTIVMAQALLENGRGHLYAFDHSRRWGQETFEKLPLNLRQHCTVSHAPIGIMKIDEVPRIFHEGIPTNLNADLIYLDSPPVPCPGENNLLFDEIDIYGNPRVIVDPLLQDNLGYFTLIIDGKKVTAHYLTNKLKDQYVVRPEVGFSRRVFIPRTRQIDT